MKVLNIHKRIIRQPKERVSELLDTISSLDDRIWPKASWPRMKMNNGLAVGSKGGHGPIRYTVKKYDYGHLLEFTFSKPTGFFGIHKLEINEAEKGVTELKHTIDMVTTGIGTLSWAIGVRWLHDALIEDAFDKVENNFLEEKKSSKWNL